MGHDGATSHGAGAWLTPRNTPIPRVIFPNLVVLLGQTVRRLLIRSTEKIDPLYDMAFQGHLRSSEPTWMDRPSMTSW